MLRVPALLFLLLLIAACDRVHRSVPEPDYHPHVLRPDRYVPTQGKRIDMDSVAKPRVVPVEALQLPAVRSKEISDPGNYEQIAIPDYTETQPVAIAEALMTEPTSFSIPGLIIEAGWPNWKPVVPAREEHSPFAHLDVKQGLHSPFVFSLLQDRKNRIWIGHHDGTLGVWDGKGIYYYTAREGLITSGGIFSLLEDRKGRIWIGTGPAVSIWNGNNFINYTRKNGLSPGEVLAFLEDSSGQIWIGTNGGLSIWNGSGMTDYSKTGWLGGRSVRCLLEDRHGDIWLGTDQGLYIWRTAAGQKDRIFKFTTTEGLSSDGIHSLLQDQRGRIWIGSETGDVDIWDGKGFTHYTTAHGLPGGQVKSMLEDREGRIWIGSGKSLLVWDGRQFRQYTSKNGLKSEGIWTLLQDHTGQIWIGTWGGGINLVNWKIFDNDLFSADIGNEYVGALSAGKNGNIWIGTARGNAYSRQTLDRESNRPGYLITLDNPIRTNILSLLEDRTGQVWINTWIGVAVVTGQGIKRYNQGGGLSHNSAFSLLEDQSGRIWIGTNGGGINVWDPNTGRDEFVQYTTEQGLTHNGVFSMIEDQQGQIWMATFAGVSVWDGKAFTHFTETEGLSDNRVWSLLEDRQGRIWIGTNGGGVNLWDGTGFYQYTEAGGLTQNIGRSLAQDQNGNIWIGTYNGLNQLIPTSNPYEWQLRKYADTDGLTGVSIDALLADSANQLWIGTSEGLNRIDLGKISSDTTHPTLYIQDLQPFFEQVDWRQIKDSLQQGLPPLTAKQQIPLAGTDFDSVEAFTNLPIHPQFPHHINDLTFHWSGTHRIAPHELLYSYFLEGNDANWSPPLPETQVRLQNLSPGDYTFKVRAVGINGRWSETAAYPFTIRPPWWATYPAYLIYSLIILGILYGLYRFQLNRRLAEAEAHRLRELDTFKSNLYTNITHEFRTPLTVIMGMAGEIRGHERIKELIQRNSRDLLQLVNQMLDLRKLEIGGLQLHLVQANIIPLLKYLVESFHSTAASRSIQLQFDTTTDRLIMDHDPERLRQVITNLLSNAIKFTPAEGRVLLQVNDREAGPDKDNVLIRVRDTGEGIPPEQLPLIFDRFYQADGSATRKAGGAGIGLALVRELVTAMDGVLSVQSEVGRGTEFSIRLPIRKQAELIESRLPEKEISVLAPDEELSASPITAPIALIVEDNRDVAEYLRACLREDYRLHWAGNGREGLELALETVPDIIISDVMMPEMDGFELCRRLKTDARTSHIPIILLTARATHEDRLEGLEKGADAYLMKPFDRAELQIRLRKLVELRRHLRAKYSKIDLDLVEPARETDPELLFLKQLQSVILDHLADEDFKVEPDLCRAMTMSRPQLYRKLKALRDISPSEYIRDLRMQQAQQLLRQGSMSIGEVASAVGFKDPSYFTKVYTTVFGEAPSAVVRK